MDNNSAAEAHEFLLTVMHDPTIALYDRIDAAGKLILANLGDNPAVRTRHVSIQAGDPPTTKVNIHGVASDAGKAPGHRPPRKHKGFYLVRSNG